MSDKKPKHRRAVRILALCAGAVLLLCGVGAGWVYWKLDHNLKTVDLRGELTAPAKDASGAMNILVLGSDSRSGANRQLAGGATNGTARSDTAMVVHVNAAHTAATVVSIPRDTLVDRPACGAGPAARGVMFNSAFEVGGASCAVRTVESMTGLDMNHYIEIDFSGFALDLGEQDEFFKQIYAKARQIGWGRTTTYGTLAKELGAGPEGARDVGQAMAKNPVPLIIPCHRVLAAGGKLGGFSAPGGSVAKARMLELEGVSLDRPPPAQQSFGF